MKENYDQPSNNSIEEEINFIKYLYSQFYFRETTNLFEARINLDSHKELTRIATKQYQLKNNKYPDNEAIAFAQWINENGCIGDSHQDIWLYKGRVFTTPELYEQYCLIFKE